MTSQIIQAWESKHMKKLTTVFRSGDTVKISVKVFEGDKERIQQFEGVVIRRQGSGLRETFTVRRMSFGVGIERTFPLSSPVIEKVVVAKKGRVRRAKLHYLRGLVGKEAKLQELQEEQAEVAPPKVPSAV